MRRLYGLPLHHGPLRKHIISGQHRRQQTDKQRQCPQSGHGEFFTVKTFYKIQSGSQQSGGQQTHDQNGSRMRAARKLFQRQLPCGFRRHGGLHRDRVGLRSGGFLRSRRIRRNGGIRGNRRIRGDGSRRDRGRQPVFVLPEPGGIHMLQQAVLIGILTHTGLL